MIDEIDLKILRILQKDARAKLNELAEAVHLTVPSVSERLHKLEDKKFIEGNHTKLNRKLFGYDITVFILVIMESSKNYKTLISKVDKIPEILECHSVLGEGSHLLKAVVKKTEDLEKLLSEIQSWPGVVSTKTTYVLSTIKETFEIKI
ncbi:MAG: Lrp/AsnC family transcriptional regulator [Ignavibacterium sp.]|nr:Lrp/AsnC family transcriptional regulator [Ignavibacterium sp.]MCX7610475.1 Lrp/AsnC family transcriptional regulator [Ignavibacterium sp.]MDW8374102.1 Lrp/AsnC family transcriptional regulator [Ignavibacteriales bacterium]